MKKLLFISVLILLSNLSFAQTAENNSLVKANGKFITLLGEQQNIGDKAPNFNVVNKNYEQINLAKFKNKIVLISAVPSLDTGICSLQTKRFNDEVAKFSDDIVFLTISNDLPFAQKRFCEQEKVNNLQVLSDSVWREFGENYGLLIKDMGLLTRAIFIIDEQGTIAYKELVADISQHPDYDTALATLKALTPKSEETPATEIKTASE